MAKPAFVDALRKAAVPGRRGPLCWICALPTEQREAVDELLREGKSGLSDIVRGLRALGVKLGPRQDVEVQQYHISGHSLGGHYKR